MKKTRSPAAGKRPGIRRRVMLYLVAFVGCVIAMLWLLQIVWLNEFYRWDKTRQLKAASDAVAQNLDNADLDTLIGHLAGRSDLCILLLDEDGRRLTSSDDIRSCLIHRMSARDLERWCDIAPEDGSVVTELFNVKPEKDMPVNPRNFRGPVPPRISEKQQSLLCVRRVTLPGGGGGYLLLNTIITPLDSTVETLRAQLVLITVVVLAGAVLLAWVISRRFARPIIETNEAARQLSRGRYEPPQHGRNYREIAELNATLVRAAEDLSRVEQLQHELIANISHDLRTPLTMIGGYAEAMRDIPGEAGPENMQIIIDEANRLTSLVSELLEFSRLQADGDALVQTDFCLTQSVRDILNRVAELKACDGYTIRFEAEDDVWIHADEKRLAQVVYNLLGNALTYTGSDKTVVVRQQVSQGRVRLSVCDSGEGIAPEELPLIWNRYYRARENHRRAVIGSGLGLSIVQRILEKHGVAYGVDSVVGEGSAFWFETDTVPPHADEEA